MVELRLRERLSLTLNHKNFSILGSLRTDDPTFAKLSLLMDLVKSDKEKNE